MEEQKNGSSVMVWTVSVIVIALIAFGGYNYMNSKSNSSTAIVETPIVNVPDTATPAPATPSSVYKDGSYSAVGTYVAPSGQESVGVSLTLAGDVVKDVTFTGNATKEDSKKYQAKFISGYKTLVVGKKISDISISKVSGSSLTPKGFMDALVKIETQAKV